MNVDVFVVQLGHLAGVVLQSMKMHHHDHHHLDRQQARTTTTSIFLWMVWYCLLLMLLLDSLHTYTPTGSGKTSGGSISTMDGWRGTQSRIGSSGVMKVQASPRRMSLMESESFSSRTLCFLLRSGMYSTSIVGSVVIAMTWNLAGKNQNVPVRSAGPIFEFSDLFQVQ
jgi:hypothetical protein